MEEEHFEKLAKVIDRFFLDLARAPAKEEIEIAFTDVCHSQSMERDTPSIGTKRHRAGASGEVRNGPRAVRPFREECKYPGCDAARCRAGNRPEWPGETRDSGRQLAGAIWAEQGYLPGRIVEQGGSARIAGIPFLKVGLGCERGRLRLAVVVVKGETQL